jgi:hypothetical protein
MNVVDVLKINELLELLPGRTYVIEHENVLSNKVKDRIYEMLYTRTTQVGCYFIILDGGMKIVKSESSETL